MKTETAVTHTIDTHHLFDTKQAAMMAHQTQFGEDNLFRKIPKELMLNVWGEEHFIQVSPTPPQELLENRVTDLFDGV